MKFEIACNRAAKIDLKGASSNAQYDMCMILKVVSEVVDNARFLVIHLSFQIKSLIQLTGHELS